jgi:hypothetical protein
MASFRRHGINRGCKHAIKHTLSKLHTTHVILYNAANTCVRRRKVTLYSIILNQTFPSRYHSPVITLLSRDILMDYLRSAGGNLQVFLDEIPAFSRRRFLSYVSVCVQKVQTQVNKSAIVVPIIDSNMGQVRSWLD